MTREQPSNIATRVILVPVANLPIARYLAHFDVNVAIYHFVPLLVEFRCTDLNSIHIESISAYKPGFLLHVLFFKARKSGAILDLPCPTIILSFRNSVIP